jgi:hypothetical protein
LSKNFKLSLDSDTEIIFRTLSAMEADSVYSIIDTYNENPIYIEQIFNTVTEYKYNIEELSSGIPLMVIYASLKVSGFLKDAIDLPSTIELYRDKLKSNAFFAMYASISKVLPSYKLPELKELSTNELFELFAYAEKVAETTMFDTEKMKKAIEAEKSPHTQAVKKGISGVTKDELELLQNILNQEEFQFQGLPHY